MSTTSPSSGNTPAYDFTLDVSSRFIDFLAGTGWAQGETYNDPACIAAKARFDHATPYRGGVRIRFAGIGETLAVLDLLREDADSMLMCAKDAEDPRERKAEMRAARIALDRIAALRAYAENLRK